MGSAWKSQSRPVVPPRWPRLRRRLAALKRSISSSAVLIFFSSWLVFAFFGASSRRSLSSTLPTESLFISAIITSSALDESLFRSDRVGTEALLLYFTRFSSREPASTSLENALAGSALLPRARACPLVATHAWAWASSGCFLHDLEPFGPQFEHHDLGQMRAFLRLDPVRASPIRVVFFWITDKG